MHSLILTGRVTRSRRAPPKKQKSPTPPPISPTRHQAIRKKIKAVIDSDSE